MRDGIDASLVRHQSGVEHRADAIVDGRLERAVRQVDGPPRLRPRSFEIELDGISRDAGRADDWNRRARKAVVVHGALEAIFPVRQGCDPVLQAPARICEDVLDRLRDRRPAHAIHELQQHRAASQIRPDLRPQIEHALLGVARIAGDQLEQVLVDRALAGDADDRNADSFLEDRARGARCRSRCPAADIGMMGDVAAEETHDAFMMDRRDDRDVGQMASSREIGIVRDESITGLHRLERVARQDGFHRADHGAEMNRDVIGLRDEPALDVEERSRAVPPLLDVGRERRADEDRPHVLRDSEEAVGEHVHLHRVCDALTTHSVTLTIRFPHGSTFAL